MIVVIGFHIVTQAPAFLILSIPFPIKVEPSAQSLGTVAKLPEKSTNQSDERPNTDEALIGLTYAEAYHLEIAPVPDFTVWIQYRAEPVSKITLIMEIF